MNNPNNPFARLDKSELYDNLINVISDLSDLAGHSAAYAAIEALRTAEMAEDRARLVDAALSAATHANMETIRLAVDMTATVLARLPAQTEQPEPPPAA